MKHEIRLKNLSPATRSSVDPLVSSLAREHLWPLLQSDDVSSAYLTAMLEKNPAQQLFKLTLRLEVSNRILFCRDEGDDIDSAADNAFSGLGARLRKHLAQQRQKEIHSLSGPAPRLTSLGERMQRSAHGDPRSQFEQIRHSLERLTKFVERELLYLQASGELASDYPTIDDVVDEVLVRALDLCQSEADVTVSESLLLRLSVSVLAERVAEARTELLEGLAVDAGYDVDPAEAIYSQEQLVEPEPGRFERLISARKADPATAASSEQIRKLLLEALRRLPASWRRMVMLSQMDELPIEVVAATLGVDERTVQTCLHHADAFLRSQLQEAAVELDDDSAPADYLVIEPPFSPVAAEIERELLELLRTNSPTKSLPVAER